MAVLYPYLCCIDSVINVMLLCIHHMLIYIKSPLFSCIASDKVQASLLNIETNKSKYKRVQQVYLLSFKASES